MNRKEGRYKDSLLSLLMLLITVTITSCDRENIDFAEKIPISFTSSVETKALISDVAGIQETGIGVTAYIRQGNTANPVMKNQQVTYSYSNGNWTYSPVSYWSKSDNYIFTAYAPFSSTTATDLDDATMTFSNIPQYQSVMTVDEIQSAKDILTDTKVGSYQKEFSNGKVQFELKHELAYLEIRAVKADITSMRNVDFKVVSLDLGDTENQMAQSVNDRTFTKNVLDNSQSNWSSVNYQNEGKYSITSIDGQQEIPNETVNSPLVLAKMLVAPFEFGGDANPHSLAFQITYNKNDKVNAPTNHDITGHAVTINKFEAGKKYIVTLRFNTASKVEINTVVVEDWTTGSTYEPPVFNW